MKIMILPEEHVHVKDVHGVHLFDIPVDEYFDYYSGCIPGEGCGEPFMIENDPDNKLYFVTNKANSEDKSLNNLFRYPYDYQGKIMHFSNIFVKKEFSDLPIPIFYIDTDDKEIIENIKIGWSRGVCMNLTSGIKYYDDSTSDSASFITTYISLINAVKNGDAMSSETAAYLHCRGCRIRYLCSNRIKERTFSQSFIDYCKEKINLQYEELTEENYTRFIDKMKEYYQNQERKEVNNHVR